MDIPSSPIQAPTALSPRQAELAQSGTTLHDSSTLYDSTLAGSASSVPMERDDSMHSMDEGRGGLFGDTFTLGGRPFALASGAFAEINPPHLALATASVCKLFTRFRHTPTELEYKRFRYHRAAALAIASVLADAVAAAIVAARAEGNGVRLLASAHAFVALVCSVAFLALSRRFAPHHEIGWRHAQQFDYCCGVTAVLTTLLAPIVGGMQLKECHDFGHGQECTVAIHALVAAQFFVNSVLLSHFPRVAMCQVLLTVADAAAISLLPPFSAAYLVLRVIVSLTIALLMSTYTGWRDVRERGVYRLLVLMMIAKQEMIVHRDLAVDVVARAVPLKIGERLGAHGGTIEIETSPRAVVAITGVRAFPTGAEGVGAALCELHNCIAFFDAAVKVFEVDRGPTLGDQFCVIANALAGSRSTPARVLRFVLWQLELPTTVITLRSAIAQDEVSVGPVPHAAGFRYGLAGRAVTKVNQLARAAFGDAALVMEQAVHDFIPRVDDCFAPVMDQYTRKTAMATNVRRAASPQAADSFPFVEQTVQVIIYTRKRATADSPRVHYALTNPDDDTGNGLSSSSRYDLVPRDMSPDRDRSNQFRMLRIDGRDALMAFANPERGDGSPIAQRRYMGSVTPLHEDAAPARPRLDNVQLEMVRLAPWTATLMVAQHEVEYVRDAGKVMKSGWDRAVVTLFVLALIMLMVAVLDRTLAEDGTGPVDYAAFALLGFVCIMTIIVVIVNRCTIESRAAAAEAREGASSDDEDTPNEQLLNKPINIGRFTDDAEQQSAARYIYKLPLLYCLVTVLMVYAACALLPNSVISRDPLYIAVMLTFPLGLVLSPPMRLPVALGMLIATIAFPCAMISVLRGEPPDAAAAVVAICCACVVTLDSCANSRAAFAMIVTVEQERVLAAVSQRALLMLTQRMIPEHAVDACIESVRRTQHLASDAQFRAGGAAAAEALTNMLVRPPTRRVPVLTRFDEISLTILRFTRIDGSALEVAPLCDGTPLQPEQHREKVTPAFLLVLDVLAFFRDHPCFAHAKNELVELCGDDMVFAGPFETNVLAAMRGISSVCSALLCTFYQLARLCKYATFDAVSILGDCSGAVMGHGTLRYGMFGHGVVRATRCLKLVGETRPAEPTSRLFVDDAFSDGLTLADTASACSHCGQNFPRELLHTDRKTFGDLGSEVTLFEAPLAQHEHREASAITVRRMRESHRPLRVTEVTPPGAADPENGSFVSESSFAVPSPTLRSPQNRARTHPTIVTPEQVAHVDGDYDGPVFLSVGRSLSSSPPPP